MFTLNENESSHNNATMKVIGVGGAGGNALQYMVENQITGVQFISANTDSQALEGSKADHCIQLGAKVTSGLGAGCNPDIGKEAAIEDRERLQEALVGADMVFIAAGMGGGTGTGAAPVIAEIARANGSLTVAVVTKPFAAEGKKRMEVALGGIEELEHNVDSLIIIPNEKLLSVLGDVTVLNAFGEANRVLHNAVRGITELITCEGLINLDFADIKSIMSQTGNAMIGVGCSDGEGRAHEAAQAAVNNPLLDDIDLFGAHGLLVNITGGADLGIKEYNEIANYMNEFASEDAKVAIGAVVDKSIEDEIRVTLIATGFGKSQDIIDLPQQLKSGPAASDDTPRYVNKEDQSPVRAVIEKDARRLQARPHEDSPDYQEYLDVPSFLRNQID